MCVFYNILNIWRDFNEIHELNKLSMNINSISYASIWWFSGIHTHGILLSVSDIAWVFHMNIYSKWPHIYFFFDRIDSQSDSIWRGKKMVASSSISSARNSLEVCCIHLLRFTVILVVTVFFLSHLPLENFKLFDMETILVHTAIEFQYFDKIEQFQASILRHLVKIVYLRCGTSCYSNACIYLLCQSIIMPIFYS